MSTNASPSIYPVQQRDTRTGTVTVLEGLLADATVAPQTTTTITYPAVDPGGPKIGRFALLVPAAIVGSLSVIVQTTEGIAGGVISPSWRTVAEFQTLTSASSLGPAPGVLAIETVQALVSDLVRVVATPGQGAGQSAAYQVRGTFK
jgi:hypothetical protein